jgi:hypothetical protein
MKIMISCHFRDEVDVQEYNELKSEFLDQTKVVSAALERMSQGDVTISSKYSLLKQDLRKAIATSFNTVEIMKIFGCKIENELEKQLNSIKEDYKLKKISLEEMELKRLDILNKIKIQNEKLLTTEDCEFLESKTRHELAQLVSIDE